MNDHDLRDVLDDVAVSILIRLLCWCYFSIGFLNVRAFLSVLEGSCNMSIL